MLSVARTVTTTIPFNHQVLSPLDKFSNEAKCFDTSRLTRLELSVTSSPLALSFVTASLASFIAVGITDADSDPLGLGRTLRFEAFAK